MRIICPLASERQPDDDRSLGRDVIQVAFLELALVGESWRAGQPPRIAARFVARSAGSPGVRAAPPER